MEIRNESNSSVSRAFVFVTKKKKKKDESKGMSERTEGSTTYNA